jgi:hypothetical protein
MGKCGLKLCDPDHNKDAKSENIQGELWFKILKSEYHGKYGKLIPENIYAY